MSPTEEEHYMRLGVVKKIKNIIHQLWPQAVVEVFGSFATGLYLPTRYVIFDFVIFYDKSFMFYFASLLG